MRQSAIYRKITNVYGIFFGGSEIERPLGRPKRRRENGIELDLGVHCR
jgi:hypothetical protein